VHLEIFLTCDDVEKDLIEKVVVLFGIISDNHILKLLQFG
jgi:hypothetical protein